MSNISQWSCVSWSVWDGRCCISIRHIAFLWELATDCSKNTEINHPCFLPLNLLNLWIAFCCLLFCFRWAVVFPWKMLCVSLTGLDSSLTWLLSLNFEFSQYCGSALLSCICATSWLFSLCSAVLPHSCASGLGVTCVCVQSCAPEGNAFWLGVSCWKTSGNW